MHKINKIRSKYFFKISQLFTDIKKAILNEALLIYRVSISDWTTTIIPTSFMLIGAFYVRLFSSIATPIDDFSTIETMKHFGFPRLLKIVLYFTTFVMVANWHNQLNNKEEDLINKPHRPIPSGLITVEGARCRTIIISIIHPIVGYFVGGFASLFGALLWLGWVTLYMKFDIHANALSKNLYTAFGSWIQLATTYHLVVGTELNINEWWDNEPSMFNLSIFFLFLTTIHIQDLGDQDGDTLVNRKTLPLLIGDVICRLLTAPLLFLSVVLIGSSANLQLSLFKNIISMKAEFIFIEKVIMVINAYICIRLFTYRCPKQDQFTYNICYGGLYVVVCFYYGMCINGVVKC
ncbi:UbiA prenyltransferase [Gigaspora margarita]|uniref:UbiA prenyltransferase n=1 Tax=Gigaspora margarita TaxID=4874 RepID=A0A8H4ALG9_GIGMA|nr:UbiA prenyltransferase [Gigaspora margarita]